MEINIKRINAYEMLDSRGTPTVASEVILTNGVRAMAFSPSGASTGKFEAHELRDNDDNRYFGKGVRNAVDNVINKIQPVLCQLESPTQKTVDRTMIELDGTENKSKLGANAVLSVSLAFAKAMAKSRGIPLFRYIGGISNNKLPTPMMNILNGGAHAANNIDIQEFMILPFGNNFSESLQMGAEVYKCLGNILKKKGLLCGVGDEGGYAPSLNSDEEAIELILEAIDAAGYSKQTVKIALDVASSEWYKDGMYHLNKRNVDLSTEQMILWIEKLVNTYPIVSVEDGLSEEDWGGWQELTEKIGNKVRLVGDDLFVTNSERLKYGIEKKAGNSILIKLNQIGTLTETVNAVNLAKENNFVPIISHRSGETEDTFISDLSVGLSAPFIKTGAPCRSDRVAKYNRLIKIEKFLS